MNRRDFLKLLGIGATTVYFDMGRGLWRKPELYAIPVPIGGLNRREPMTDYFENSHLLDVLRYHGAIIRIDGGCTIRGAIDLH